MRKGCLVDSDNEYDAGHIICYHTNYAGNDNKGPQIMRRFI